MTKKKKHTVSNTRVTTTHIVQPGDTNPHGTIFGGKVMQWIDTASAIAAIRHCRKPVVTASIGDLHFLHPVKLGNIVIVHAEVTYTGSTSMEVEAAVLAEDRYSGEKNRTSTAHLTMVAVDEKGHPTKIKPIVPETADEMARYAAAKQRKEARIKRFQERNEEELNSGSPEPEEPADPTNA